MDLYLIRHAEAVDLGEQGIEQDEDRPLTDVGLAQAQLVAKCLQNLNIQLDAVLTSPYLRARQTAETILQYWSEPLPKLVECEDLAIGGKRRKIARVTTKQGGESVALVGHEPDISSLAAWLIGSAKAQIRFAKAGIAYIRCSLPAKGTGTLMWLVTPAWQGNVPSPTAVK
ncbi:MAG: phosphohistidine phosphatase SixA [Gemmataceae bacterium]